MNMRVVRNNTFIDQSDEDRRLMVTLGKKQVLN